MSAIETCRTAALGGHIEGCEDCGHSRIAYNSCRNRHCPKCQGAAAREWLAAARGRPAAGRLFPRRLHRPRRGRRHRLPQQGGRLRPAVPRGVGDDAHHRRRPPSSRRAHRHHRRPPHLGLGDDAPPAHPHDRARRRDLARRRALGLVAAGLPAAGPRACQAVPPALPDTAARAACRSVGFTSSATMSD